MTIVLYCSIMHYNALFIFCTGNQFLYVLVHAFVQLCLLDNRFFATANKKGQEGKQIPIYQITKKGMRMVWTH